MLFKRSQETSFCLYVCFLNGPKKLVFVVSFLNGPKKLVFVRMYERTIIGLVLPPYPYCSLVTFCAFTWLHICAVGAFFVLFCAFSV